ncbi:hypothetical protein C1646_762278 [Rhizophagus diaphanus]|nr:hypothetical protein C1646_762278 [Rhizophagus diaphanus] [Rhizophagus sp. MUCL 43196]
MGNPFSGSVFTGKYNFIEIYLNNLNDDGNIENQIIYPTLNLVENIKQNLNYLSIEIDIYEIKSSDFEVFLKNIQDIFIKKLAILTRNQNLFDLKDEVKEFKLYDIRVRSYFELLIDTLY